MGILKAPRNAEDMSAGEYTLLDLPALIIHCILAFLDPQSIWSLGSTCTGLLTLVERQARRLNLPLDTLRKHRLAPQGLADRYPSTRALAISHAHQRVALSCCGTLHRSLQIVNVFLDNARGAWGGLTSLDLMDAVPHIIPLTADILVEGLPSLQQLALPGSSTPAAEAPCLAPLSRLTALRELSLGSLHVPVQSNHPLRGLTTLTSLSLVCSPAMPATSSASPAAAAAAPAQPFGAGASQHQHSAWAGLNSLQQLESLSVSSAAEVAALLAAAAPLPRLTQLYLRGARLPTAAAAGGVGGGGGGGGSATARAALSALHRMKQLARLQFSPAAPSLSTAATTSTSSSSSRRFRTATSSAWPAAGSIALAAAAGGGGVGGSLSGVAGCPAGAGGPLLPAGALHHLGLLAEVDLAGWTVDGPVLGALASCKQLRRLKVGGLVVSPACPPTAPLASLRRLEVAGGAWALGSTQLAADMLPGLTALSIRQADGACPDLRPLKAHPCLAELAVEVGDPEPLGHQLAWLVAAEALTSLEVAAGDSSRPWHSGCHLPQLRRLVLRRATSDTGLASLPAALGCLHSLTLEGCYYVSDHGLGKVAGLPHLQEVTLVGCPHVTEDGVSRLLAHTALQRLAVVGCGGDSARLLRLAARCRERGPHSAQLQLVLPDNGPV